MKSSISKQLFSLAKTPLGDLIVGLAFGKFSKVLPIKKIKETKNVIAFWHPKPYWEKHILIVPKRAITKITALNLEDGKYIKEVYMVAKEIVKELGWESGGYTLLTNGGNRQEVNQIHFHLYTGKKSI